MTTTINTTGPTLCEVIAERQALTQKTDQQISEDMGYCNANVFTMIKSGAMKLPFESVGLLAEALRLSYAELLTTVVRDYAPTLMAAIHMAWPATALTHNERKLVESFRVLAKGRDVVPIVMDGQSIIALVAA